jgi:putative redox protein
LRAWVRDPEWFLEYARSTGVLHTTGFPPEPSAWIRAIANLDPLAAAKRVSPRPWLLVHGSADDVVPVDDARLLADASGNGVELRILANGAHRLRHDPRAIATLLGWLDRQEP